MRTATFASGVALRLIAVGLTGSTWSMPSLADTNASLPSIKFGDFFRQPIGPRGLEFTDTLRAAQGQTVRLVGWMVAQETPSAGYFLLTPRPVRLSEHADGEADDLPPTTVLVRLPAGNQARALPHQDGLIELLGTLAMGRAVEADGRVSWVQLQLPAPP